MSRDFPVVLVHGMTASTDWWRPTIAALESHHDVRIVELRGLPVREAAQRLAEWLDTEGLRGAALVGHSMGGAVVVETAADAPEPLAPLLHAAARPLDPHPCPQPAAEDGAGHDPPRPTASLAPFV